MKTVISVVGITLLIAPLASGGSVDISSRYSFGAMFLEIDGWDVFSMEDFTEDLGFFETEFEGDVDNLSGLHIHGEMQHFSDFGDSFVGRGFSAADLDHTGGGGTGRAIVSEGNEVEFSLSQTTYYELDVEITEESDGANSSNVELLIEGPNGTVLNISDPGPHFITGELEAGDYFFGLGSIVYIEYAGGNPPVHIDAFAHYDFSMTFEPIPEPASLWILCVGAMALRRRR